jgi:hypothetical protein
LIQVGFPAHKFDLYNRDVPDDPLDLACRQIVNDKILSYICEQNIFIHDQAILQIVHAIPEIHLRLVLATELDPVFSLPGRSEPLKEFCGRA